MNRKGVIVLFLFLFAVFFRRSRRRQRTACARSGRPGPRRLVASRSLRSGADAAAAKIPAVLDAYVKAGIDSLFILVKNTTGHVYFQTQTGVPDPAYGYDFFDLF